MFIQVADMGLLIPRAPVDLKNLELLYKNLDKILIVVRNPRYIVGSTTLDRFWRSYEIKG